MAGTDREGLEAFCRREHPRLVRSLALYTGDALLAEELAQDAFVMTCRKWPAVRDMASPAGWLHRVGLNCAHMHFRRKSAERRALDRRRNGEALTYEQPDTASALALRAALADLPDRQRAVLVLRYFADFGVAEVGELLDLRDEAVRALTYRAMTALRERGHELREPGQEVSGAR